MTSTALLHIRDLTVSIRTSGGTTPVVRGVSLDLFAGRTLAIVGESGSGKTMTAMSVLGLGPPGTPLSLGGEALFDGRDLLTMPDREMRALRGNRIGAVFQDPAGSMNPLMPVGEQIREAARSAGADRGVARAKVAALLDEVGLAQVPGIAGRYPHELSGGQQQRCMIALALAGDPDLLVADEPTTALDSDVADQIIGLLADLRARRRMALLFISHDLGVVSRLAQDIVVMRDGQVVESGSTGQILQNPQQDYTKALIDCTPGTGARTGAVDDSRHDPKRRRSRPQAASYAGAHRRFGARPDGEIPRSRVAAARASGIAERISGVAGRQQSGPCRGQRKRQEHAWPRPCRACRHTIG